MCKWSDDDYKKWDELLSERCGEKWKKPVRLSGGGFNTMRGVSSKSVQFIFELLQNAHDADSKNVYFLLTNEQLVFGNDGNNLSYNNAVAITENNNSDKVNDGDKVGRFGLGFKCVGEITREVKIYSKDIAFSINEFLEIKK
jgi:HSP90 family molecular chaperone